MTNEQAISAAIQLYFDSMYESNADKVHAVFHPNAKITGYMGNRLVEQSVTEFAQFVAAQQPSAQKKGEPILLETLSLDITGNTAVAKVRDGYLGLTLWIRCRSCCRCPMAHLQQVISRRGVAL